jgi:HSP20 family molecular chaperone IbpA
MSLIAFDDFFYPTHRPVVRRCGHSPSHYEPYGLFAHLMNDSFGQLQQLERQLGELQRPEATNGKGDGGKEYSFKCSVAGYHPEELTVDVQGDELLISGEHSQKGEGQSIHRTFKRCVTLPQDVHKESIQCNINEQGQLEVRAERKQLDQAPKLNIPIGFKESSKPEAAANPAESAEKPKDE